MSSVGRRSPSWRSWRASRLSRSGDSLLRISVTAMSCSWMSLTPSAGALPISGNYNSPSFHIGVGSSVTGNTKKQTSKYSISHIFTRITSRWRKTWLPRCRGSSIARISCWWSSSTTFRVCATLFLRRPLCLCRLSWSACIRMGRCGSCGMWRLRLSACFSMCRRGSCGMWRLR